MQDWDIQNLTYLNQIIKLYMSVINMNSCDFYVKRISSLKTNTAENILSIGLVMKEAKLNLSKDDFQSFLKSTHYEEKSSSVRKWIQIGNAYQRLRPIAHKLPVAWSTIYKLSKIDSIKFDLLERMNILHSEITAREIDEHLSVKNRANAKKIQLTLKFDLNVSPASFKRLHDSISKLISNSICEVTLTDEAEALLNAANSNPSLLKHAA